MLVVSIHVSRFQSWGVFTNDASVAEKDTLCRCFAVGATRRTDPCFYLVPAGLNPGDTYQLVFVTAGGHNAYSTPDIGVYNAFVQAQAELFGSITENYGIHWHAIAFDCYY